MAEWRNKRVVAMCSTNEVVQIDGVDIDMDLFDLEHVDSTLKRLGKEGWELVGTNNTEFEGCPAIQYTFKKETGNSRGKVVPVHS